MRSVRIHNRTATFGDIVGSRKLEQYYAQIKKIMDVKTLENTFVRIGKPDHIKATVLAFEQIENVEVVEWRQLDKLVQIFMEKFRYYTGQLTTYEARMDYDASCNEFEIKLKEDLKIFKRCALDYVENPHGVDRPKSHQVEQKKDELELKSQLGLLNWGETAQHWLLKIPGTVNLLESCFL